MNKVPVYIELKPEHYDSPLSITINCKESEYLDALAIIDYLRSYVNVENRDSLKFKWRLI